MIEVFTFRELHSNKYKDIPTPMLRDRKDIYIPTDEFSMVMENHLEKIFEFELYTMECSPDFDW